MAQDNDNEVVIEQVIYAFASASLARSFVACLHTATLAACKENWQPVGIFPPLSLDVSRL